MKRSEVLARLFAILSTAACASTTSGGTTPEAAPATPPATPGAETPAEPAAAPEELTLEQARAIVDEIQAQWPVQPNDPLLTPKTLDAAEKILKLDQVTLFPAAIDYLSTQEGLRALTLHGQIELAWGEAYIILVEIMRTLHQTLDQTAETLAARGASAPLGAEEQAELAELRAACAELQRAGPAFAMLIVEHLNAGEKSATAAMEQFPKSYLGFRVAADFHRLMEDWPAFSEMLEEVKKRNPDSNGLRFLRGAEAFQDRKDRAAAAAFYKDALARDPAFVRAQSHLLMAQADAKGLHEELAKLRKMNPNHQIVAWIGQYIERAYESWKQQNPTLVN